MRILTTCALLALGLQLAACEPQAPTAPEAAVASAPATPEPAVAAAPATAPTTIVAPMIAIDPAALRTCDPPSVVRVLWETSAAPEVATVDIFAVNADGSEALFATQGTPGETQTGAWGQPGLTLVLRDHASARELGRATVGAIACP
jgi:hypothetical protein